MDKLITVFSTITFILCLLCAIYGISFILEKPFKEDCKKTCVNGYSFLVCETGVVQMMEGEGDDIYLSLCNEP
jgi:hypothetical protein